MNQTSWTDERVRMILDYPEKLGHLIGKTRLTGIHGEWIRYIWGSDKDVSLQAHRNSYKTTAVIIVGSIRWLLFHPEARIAIIRKTFTDAAAAVKTIADAMDTEVIRSLFRYVHKSYPRFTTRREGKLGFNFKKSLTPEVSIEAHGLGPGLTGSHYTKILCDDFVTLKDRLSKAERKNTKAIVREIQANIIEQGQFVSYLGTVWHSDDCWSIVPEAEKFDVYRLDIMTEAEIEEKRKKMTDTLFAANYELKHISSDDQMFTDPTFGAWDFKVKNIVAQVDAAFDGTHYCALTIMGERADNKIQAIGWVYSGNIRDWFGFIKGKMGKYRAVSIYVEDNPDHGYTAQRMRDLGLSVISYHESMNKRFKIGSYLKEFWERLIFSENSDDEYMLQITDYLPGQEPDDAIDSAASLLREGFARSGYNDILFETA